MRLAHQAPGKEAGRTPPVTTQGRRVMSAPPSKRAAKSRNGRTWMSGYRSAGSGAASRSSLKSAISGRGPLAGARKPPGSQRNDRRNAGGVGAATVARSGARLHWGGCIATRERAPCPPWAARTPHRARPGSGAVSRTLPRNPSSGRSWGVGVLAWQQALQNVARNMLSSTRPRAWRTA